LFSEFNNAEEGTWKERGRDSNPFFEEEGISHSREKLRLPDG
jgi:hypothetical protein